MAPDENSGARPAGPVVLRIKLRYDDIETMVQRFAPNVGKSGLFLPTKSIQPIGTEVKFELRIASDAAVLVGLGRVKHTKPPDPAAPKAAFGMAIELMRVSREGRELILRMLERRRALGLPEVAIPVPEDVDAAKRTDDSQPRTDVSGVVREHMPKLASAPIAESVLGSQAPASGPIAVAKSPVAEKPAARAAPAAPERPLAQPEQPLAQPEPAPQPKREPEGKAQTKIAALAPETAKPKRPRVADLMAKMSEQGAGAGPGATPMPPELDENIDVARVLARARALAGSDLDSELAALREVAAAPLEISIEAASAELARQLGGKPISKRERSAKWVPPPAVEIRAERTPAVEPPPAEPPSVEPPPSALPSVDAPSVEVRSVQSPSVELRAEPMPSIEAPAVEPPAPAPAPPEPAAAERAAAERAAAEPEATASTEDASSDEHARPSESPQQARERRRNRTFSRKRRESSRSQEMPVPTERESSPELERAKAGPAKRVDDVPTATGDALAALDDGVAEFAQDVKTRVPTGEDYADVIAPTRLSFSSIDEEALRTEPAIRPSSNLMIDDAADPDMLARALEGSAPAMRLSESDIEPIEDDAGERTMIGAFPAAPAEQLADLVDRHLADAEAEADDDFRELHSGPQQAAYHIGPYHEAPLDEHVPAPSPDDDAGEEISDLDVVAEADEADADLLSAHGEADVAQRGRPRRPEVTRLPTDDFASRLDLGDDTPAPQPVPQSLRYSPEAHSEDLDSALAALDGDFDEAASQGRKQRPLPGLPVHRPQTAENPLVKPKAKAPATVPRKNPTTPPALPVRTPPKRATTDDGILIDFDDDE